MDGKAQGEKSPLLQDDGYPNAEGVMSTYNTFERMLADESPETVDAVTCLLKTKVEADQVAMSTKKMEAKTVLLHEMYRKSHQLDREVDLAKMKARLSFAAELAELDIRRTKVELLIEAKWVQSNPELSANVETLAVRIRTCERHISEIREDIENPKGLSCCRSISSY